VCDGIAEELAYQFVDTAVESCREQQALTFTRCLFQNASDMLEESKLCHVICFVQNGDFNSVEFNLARLHKVDETAGTCHNNVNAIAHGIDLSVVANAAVHGGCAHTKCIGKWHKDVTYLVC